MKPTASTHFDEEPLTGSTARVPPFPFANGQTNVKGLSLHKKSRWFLIVGSSFGRVHPPTVTTRPARPGHVIYPPTDKPVRRVRWFDVFAISAFASHKWNEDAPWEWDACDMSLGFSSCRCAMWMLPLSRYIGCGACPLSTIRSLCG